MDPPKTTWTDDPTPEAILQDAALARAAGSEEDSARPVLGRDPFASDIEFDPFTDGLAALGIAPPKPSAQASAPAQPDRAKRIDTPPRAQPSRLPKGRPATTPRLSDLEPLEPEGLLERWLGPDERRRLAALQHLVEAEVSYDRFGLSPDALRRSFPYFYALYRLYFRVQSRGHENVPERGAVVLASNHGGLLPFDGAMLITDLLLHTDPPRLARSVVDRWAGKLPWINVYYARVGQVIGTRENVADLLDDGQMVLVFPEGVAGIRKTITQRRRVQTFRVGFVEEALRAGVPIVPTAVVGSDDQAPILHDFQGLARRLGLPALPITPTFPLFGPIGLLPYPVRYRIVYGEPMALHERFGPDDADDPQLVRYLARQVRHRVQQLVDRQP
jgi:1-acyl-sn-glycerol-3-phosphate acyltransferase